MLVVVSVHYIVRGGVRCDERSTPDELVSPYLAWGTTGDPEPMIYWLEKAVKEKECECRMDGVEPCRACGGA